MFFTFLLLIVGMMVYLEKHEANSDGLLDPENFHQLCPYSSFCGVEGPLNTTDINEGFTPCCASCSCSSDCGLKRTCCTPEFDKYKLDETLGTVCKALDTRPHSYRDQLTYHVVEKCQKTNITCKSMNVTRWGSYWPVYSKSSGLIFHNKKCAICNDQEDIVTLLPTFNCLAIRRYDSVFIKGSESLNGISSSDDCFIQFIAPRSMNMTSEICRKDVVNSCECKLDSESQQNQAEMCSRINAPYFNGVHYKNAFCYMCNACKWDSYLLDFRPLCRTTVGLRASSDYRFIALLDTETIQKLETEKPTNRKNVCFVKKNANSSKVCLPVHCPEGRFYVDGECVFLGNTWRVDNLQIFLNLTYSNPSDGVITLAELENLDSNDRYSRTKDFLMRPEFHDWNIEIFFNAGYNDTVVRYFVVILFLPRSRNILKPQTFFKQIRNMIQRQWKIVIRGKHVRLKAQFSRHIRFGLKQRRPVLELQPIGNERDVNNNYGFKITHLSQYFDFYETTVDRLCITKLYYCETVELSTDYFLLLIDTVLLVEQKKLLLSGEYQATTDGLSAMRVRVCVSDVLEKSNAVNPGILPFLYVLYYLYFYTPSQYSLPQVLDTLSID